MQSIGLLNNLMEQAVSGVFESKAEESRVLVIQHSELFDKNALLDNFRHTLSSAEMNDDVDFCDRPFSEAIEL